MYTPERLNLFTRRVSKLRFPKSKGAEYKILALPENVNLVEIYDDLNIMKTDIKTYCSPKFKLAGKIVLTDKDSNKIMKNNGFTTYPYIKKVDDAKRNTFVDLSQFANVIRTRLKDKFNSPRASMLFSTGMGSFASSKDFKNILLYIIDLRKPFNVALNKRLGWIPIFHNLKHKENIPYISSMIVCIISVSGKPTYIKLFDKNEKINYTRASAILKAIKISDSNLKAFGEKISEEVVLEKEDITDVKKASEKTLLNIPIGKTQDAIKESISHLAKAHPESASKIVDEMNVKPTNQKESLKKKKLILALLKYKITNNKEDFQKSIDDINKTTHRQNTKENLKAKEKNIDKEINHYVERSSTDFKVVNLSTQPTTKEIDVKKVLDNNIPSKIIESKQKSFNTQLFNDLVKMLKTFNGKEYPLKLEKYSLVSKRDERDLKASDIVRFKFTMVDKEGAKFNNEIHLPYIDENGNMKINGLKKVLIGQLMLKPVYFPQAGICKISTFYSTIQLQYRTIREKSYVIAYVTGMVVPLYLLFSMLFKRGLDDLFSKLGYSRKDLIVTKNPIDTKKAKKENAKWFIQFKNNEYIFFPVKVMESNKYARSFFHSMKLINYAQRDVTSENFLDNDFLEAMLIIVTGKKNSGYNLRSFFNGFLDPISIEVIETQKYPTDLENLLWKCTELIHTDKYDRRTDLNIQRFRNTETFLHLLYKQLLMAYNVFKNQKLIGYNKPEFTLKPEFVFKEVVNTQLVRGNETINPIEELAAASRISYVGVGGVVNSDGVSEKMRIVDETYYGTIDTIDTPEGGSNIGMLQHLTVGALTNDSRGSFELSKINNDAKTGISSVSSVMTPFYNHNDSARLMMASNQIRQAVPLVNKELPLVQTGYETALTTFLSESFIKKSKFAGVVKEVTDLRIVVESLEKGSRGKKQIVDLDPAELTSGMTMHTLSYFVTKVKVGQKVKKYQLLAEGSSVKDGTISLGTNLLVAYMPFDGANHDDSMIISSRLSKNLGSKHIEKLEFHILPNSKILKVPGYKGEVMDQRLVQKLINPLDGIPVERGDVLLSYIPNNISEFLELNPEERLYTGGIVKHKASHSGKIMDVKIYSNEDINRYPKLKQLHSISSDKNVENYDGRYKIKGEKFEGIIIKIIFEYLESGMNKGDKYCNRHGNKGVVARVEEKMPKTPWGQEIDIILNPLGVIGRMNIGQLYECYSGLIAWKVRELILKTPTKKNLIDIITKVYYKILDKTQNKIISKTVINVIKKMTTKNVKTYIENIRKQKGFPWIFPTFGTPSSSDIMSALKAVGLKDKYILDLPHINSKTKKPVTVGYIYMYKMEHVSSKKISSRSVGKYINKIMQPTAGKKAKGGQRVGEFDSWSLFAYGAKNIIKEMYGPLSDDYISKNEIISNIIESGSSHNIDKLKVTPTRDLLEIYFRIMMLDTNRG